MTTNWHEVCTFLVYFTISQQMSSIFLQTVIWFNRSLFISAARHVDKWGAINYMPIFNICTKANIGVWWYHVLRHTISCKTWAWHQTVCKKNHPFFAPLSIWQIVRLLYLCNFYAPLWWHYRLFSSRSNPILLPKWRD